MNSAKTISDRLKERETWVLIYGNVLGLLVATGVLGSDEAQEFAGMGNETIGLIFSLATNFGLLLSRGIAKIGTGN